MGLGIARTVKRFAFWSRQEEPAASRRFGGRATIDQPGLLEVHGRSIPGVIQNVGLRGVFFAALELPEVDACGTLWGPSGRKMDVRVTWRSLGATRGVGLSFDAPPPN